MKVGTRLKVYESYATVVEILNNGYMIKWDRTAQIVGPYSLKTLSKYRVKEIKLPECSVPDIKDLL